METVYDGVAELWWDSEQDFRAVLESAEGAAAAGELLEDEARFIDLPRSSLHLAWEYPQINPAGEDLLATPESGLLKLYFPLRALVAVDDAAARQYWHVQHGPLIRSHASDMGVQRYLQVHRADLEAGEALRESRGIVGEPYLGHAELWFPEEGRSDDAARAANRAAVEDEAKFIDFTRSCLWVCHEHSIVDRR